MFVVDGFASIKMHGFKSYIRTRFSEYVGQNHHSCVLQLSSQQHHFVIFPSDLSATEHS